jgi:hypothetical protein
LSHLREEHDQKAKEDCWNDLQTKRNLPLSIVGIVKADICPVGNPRSAETSNTQHELL